MAETFAGVPDGRPMRTPSAAGPLARSGLAVLTRFLTRGASATAATVTLTVIQVSISHSAGGVVTEGVAAWRASSSAVQGREGQVPVPAQGLER